MVQIFLFIIFYFTFSESRGIALRAAAPPRKKPRSVRLLGCKRAHDGFALMLLHVPKRKKIEKADHFTVIGFLFKSGVNDGT